MTSEDIQEQAVRIVALWKQRLLYLQEQHLKVEEPASFTGLLAFLGLHLALRSLWWRENAPSGLKQSNRRLDTFVPGVEPWECVCNPISDHAAWILVQNESIPFSARFYDDLAKPHVRAALRNLCDSDKNSASDSHRMGAGPAAKEIHISGAREVFIRWGVYQGGNKPLNLPFLRCDQLIALWPTWWQSVQPLIESLRLVEQTSMDALPQANTVDLRRQFSTLAAAIWLQLQEENLMAIDSVSDASWKRFFRRRKQTQAFCGLMLLQGDHHTLWESIRQDCDE